AEDHLYRDAQWIGDRMYVARQKLLDSGLYNNELIEQLPSAGNELNQRKASSMSMQEINIRDNHDLQDEVEITEIWMPDAKIIITVPGAKDVVFDDYLRVDDYYGPDTGPYTFLGLTPPVSGNPLPVPMVGIWHDLHVLCNRMAEKTINQADRQKDIVVYRRSAADDADELRNSADGDTVAVDDPSAVDIKSFGGQQQSNEIMTSQIQGWFNQMAANPQAVGGQSLDADSATEAKILAGNANIVLEDSKDLVYQWVAAESGKRAWYMHTDPFINVPLIRRDQIPAQYEMTRQGPIMKQAAQMQDVQIMLTPEARRGDWLDFTFSIEPESMGRIDAATRLRQAMDFAIKVMPSAVQTAQLMALIQVPFDVKAFIIRMAKDVGIKWMDEIFYDPDFQMKMAMIMMQGPGMQSSQGAPGTPNGQAGAGPGGLAALIQNGQFANVMNNPNEEKLFRQNAQEGANAGQAELRLGGGY
ncbi:hypothetical protein LCGC14_1917810, partial [marine sediment metagenome]